MRKNRGLVRHALREEERGGAVARARRMGGGSGQPAWHGHDGGGHRLGDAKAREERVEGPWVHGPVWARWHGPA
jgi:hypothetical protein